MMAGYRNRLVHMYHDVNADELFGSPRNTSMMWSGSQPRSGRGYAITRR